MAARKQVEIQFSTIRNWVVYLTCGFLTSLAIVWALQFTCEVSCSLRYGYNTLPSSKEPYVFVAEVHFESLFGHSKVEVRPSVERISSYRKEFGTKLHFANWGLEADIIYVLLITPLMSILLWLIYKYMPRIKIVP